MMNTVKINEIDLCYETFGTGNGKTIVLIAGLGSQMIRWDNLFCQLLVDQGFQVIRFDNRDSGYSFYNGATDLIPDLKNIRPEDIPYSLQDMAKDVIGLLDHLNIKKAHIAGRSMGGVITQLLASLYPERVLSITMIMSTSINPSLPPVRPEIMAMMTKPPIDPSVDKEGFIRDKISFARIISGPVYALDEAQESMIIEAELARSKSKNGTFRQMLAMGSTIYNEDLLKQIESPALVIHGTEDPIFHVDCAHDLTNSIASSKLLIMEGMGHSIPRELYHDITKAITDLTG